MQSLHLAQHHNVYFLQNLLSRWTPAIVGADNEIIVEEVLEPPASLPEIISLFNNSPSWKNLKFIPATPKPIFLPYQNSPLCRLALPGKALHQRN